MDYIGCVFHHYKNLGLTDEAKMISVQQKMTASF
jgi:hypothetical protein